MYNAFITKWELYHKKTLFFFKDCIKKTLNEYSMHSICSKDVQLSKTGN
jgi:hypothetical protein